MRLVKSGTVFSQLQKRNIDHKEFETEVDRYEKDAVAAAARRRASTRAGKPHSAGGETRRSFETYG